MTPYRPRRRGQQVKVYYVDRSFRGIGRIEKTTGTTDLKRAKRIEAMLDELYEHDCLDVLRAIRVNRLALDDVYRSYLAHGIRRFHVLERTQELQPLIDAWLPRARLAPKTQHDYRNFLRRLLAGHTRAMLTELPEILRNYDAPAPTFNRTRAACLALLRDTSATQLRHELRDIPMRTERRKAGHPLPVEHAREIAQALGVVGLEWWTLCCTGMGWKEYTSDGWEVYPDRIVIHGKKTPARERFIPRIVTPVDCSVSEKLMRKLLQPHGVGIYDGRRTFMHFMEMANIPRSRRMRYFGHTAGDVTGLYEDHSPEYYLAADTQRLKEYAGKEPRRLQVVG